MRRAMLGVCVAAAAICGAMAQTADEKLTFEVASIKPAAPMQPGRMMIGMRGGPGTQDPGHLNYSNVSLKSMLVTAFGVKSYQISGPAWLDSERFDLVAKIPEGTTKDQVKFMMRNLLEERFHLAVHHDTKEMPMYALVVGKNGPKMKESPDDPPAPATGGPSDDAPKLSNQMAKVSVSADGTLKLPPGIGPKNGCMMMMMMSPAGPKTHMQCSKQDMSGLSEQLSNQMDRPVNDLTGLTAKYDFNLDFLPDESRMQAMMPAGAMAMTHEMAGSPGPGGPKGDGPGPDAATVVPLPAALQEQLGLKLEQKKGSVDMIVVDKMDKAPTEN